MHTSVSELPACLATKTHTTVPNIIHNTSGCFTRKEYMKSRLHYVHDVPRFWQNHGEGRGVMLPGVTSHSRGRHYVTGQTVTQGSEREGMDQKTASMGYLL